jgi:hypothetical protein
MTEMDKRLIAIGNGYGLLIDKALRRALDIGPDTTLHVTTDGVRLIVEPYGDGGPRPTRKKLEAWDHPKYVQYSQVESSEERRLQYHALAVAAALQRKGVTHEQFTYLNHRVAPWDVYENMIERRLIWDEDRVDMRRVEVCWTSISNGVSLEDAIAAARTQVPMGPLQVWSSHRSYCLGDGCACKGTDVTGLTRAS